MQQPQPPQGDTVCAPTAEAFAASLHAADPLELCVVVPTYNEVDNVNEVVKRLVTCLRGVTWELIFVDDDSPDGTADAVRRVAVLHSRVRCLQRIGRRGLSSACIEGMLATAAPYIAVMDGDLQHDESLLLLMLETLRTDNLDVVVGSRYVDGGSVGSWEGSRILKSRLATRLSRWLLQVDLADPMSGFFMIRRETITEAVRNLSGLGFKILLDIFASSPRPLKFRELPYEFRERLFGESKLDSAVIWEFVMMLLDKRVGHIVPVRFVTFSIVGGLGVITHFAVLTALFQGARTDFVVAQAAATLVAMTSNFVLNNVLTYRDVRLRRWGLLRGWISFTLACGIGAIANVGVADYLFKADTSWALSALAGVIVGAVWNYAVTAVYTWQSVTLRRK